MTTYDEIQAKVLAMGYQFFTGDLNLNMIWERTSHIFTNKMSDFLHVVYQQDGNNLVLTIPATTKPGLNGEGAILNPPTVHGVTGTDVIIPNAYSGTWQFRDEGNFLPGKGWPWNYPYFQQIKGVDYWRDGDKVLNITTTNEHISVDGTNWHVMSNKDTDGSGNVNNWSEGCMGSVFSEWNKILPVVRASVAKYGNIFTGTLIDTTPNT